MKKSPSKSILPVVEEGAHHVERLTQARERFLVLPVEVVLRHQAEVAGRDHRLGAPAGDLVERRELLADQRGLAQEHVGHVGPETNPFGLVGRRGEQHPQVLVPGLVDRVAGVVAELVRRLDHLDRVVDRVVRQHAVAELHSSSLLGHRLGLEAQFEHRIREVVVHPVEVVPAGGHDPLGVPGRQVLLGEGLHLLRIHLVDVLEALDHVLVDPLRLGWLLVAQPEDAHS